MLNKDEQIKALKALRYSDADIAEMMADGDVALKPQTGIHILTDTELTETKGRVKSGHEEAFKEIWGKSLNDKYSLGLTTTEAKDADKVIAAMQAKAAKDAGAAPDAQVAELQKSIKKLQEETIPAIEAERDSHKAWRTEKETVERYSQHLHPERNKALTDAEWIARLKAAGDIEVVDGVEYIKGIKDAKERPVMAKDHYTELYKKSDNWLIAAPAPAADTKKPTFGIKPTGGTGKKFADNTAILGEVERQLGTTKGSAAAKLYNSLVVENKQ